MRHLHNKALLFCKALFPQTVDGCDSQFFLKRCPALPLQFILSREIHLSPFICLPMWRMMSGIRLSVFTCLLSCVSQSAWWCPAPPSVAIQVSPGLQWVSPCLARGVGSPSPQTTNTRRSPPAPGGILVLGCEIYLIKHNLTRLCIYTGKIMHIHVCPCIYGRVFIGEWNHPARQGQSSQPLLLLEIEQSASQLGQWDNLTSAAIQQQRQRRQQRHCSEWRQRWQLGSAREKGEAAGSGQSNQRVAAVHSNVVIVKTYIYIY